METNAQQQKLATAIMQKMVYARTVSKYLDLYAKLCHSNLPAMEVCQQWAGHFTNSHENYLNRTTNGLESINQKLKSVVTKYGTLQSFLMETLDCIQSLGLARDQRTTRSNYIDNLCFMLN